MVLFSVDKLIGLNLYRCRVKLFMMTNSASNDNVRKLLESLQSDLKNISLETRKKHPAVKESAEEAIVKIRNAGLSNSNTPLAYLSNQILYPLVQVIYLLLYKCKY